MKSKIKQKIKIFIIESLFLSTLLCTLLCIMIFTLIHNSSLFSIFHINDESEHLIYKDTISNNTLSIYEIGEPVFFEESHISIRLSGIRPSISLSIDNNGKKITDENIIVTWKDSIPYITISGINQKEITYVIQ